MTKHGKMMRVMVVMLLASFVLASLSLVAQAWWYNECRYHHTYLHSYQVFACGYTCYYRDEYHTWKCHDGSGYCYDTGQVCKDEFAGMLTCQSYCP